MRSETENQILDMTVRQLWEKETDDYVRYLRDSTSDTDAAKLHEFYRAAADLYKERASYYKTARGTTGMKETKQRGGCVKRGSEGNHSGI